MSGLPSDTTSLQGRINKALDLIDDYGMVDGAHHKQWTLDQVVRALKGEEYKDWVLEYEAGGVYWWDEGIAP